MIDERDLLERAHRGFEPEPGLTERVYRRRDHKLRKQRITAGAVGIVVFVAAVWIVRDVASLDSSETVVPAGPGATRPAESDATSTQPGTDGHLEPGESLPSSDTWSTDPLGAGRDEVVAHFDAYNSFVYVYADGRVITHPHRSPLVEERHLTPEGVDLVRSGVVGPDQFLSPSYDWADFPEGTWADHDSRPYVPSRYAVCFYQEVGDPDPGHNGGYEFPSTALPFFPASARDILGGEVTRGEAGTSYSANRPECSEVTRQEVEALNNILGGVRVEDADGNRIWWETDGVLPHGARTSCLTCA